ncbi:hypothetical protein AVEN_60155-1 [Araneus ventricosus]|uniref:Uncharacterized protein n=1 Tax=Araneus ventricosus TaxID=182803 RepID=A0A4Y2RX11_ARAVE|nr:hypothetical protein AVEN_60155-1 [Araneus ventricosus]
MCRTVIWHWHAVQRGAGSPNNRCLCVNRVCPILNLIFDCLWWLHRSDDQERKAARTEDSKGQVELNYDASKGAKTTYDEILTIY